LTCCFSLEIEIRVNYRNDLFSVSYNIYIYIWLLLLFLVLFARVFLDDLYRERYKWVFFSVVSIKPLVLHTRPICYIIIHFDFFSFALCMLLKWAECQVRLHKRHARLLMNYSLTIRYMYVYMSVIRSVAAYWHTVPIKKKQKMKEKRRFCDEWRRLWRFFPLVSFLLNYLTFFIRHREVKWQSI
jgi:hypothetical protein